MTRRRGEPVLLAVLCLLVGFLSLLGLMSSPALADVTVDLSINDGSVTPGQFNGFHHGFDTVNPPDAILTPLKPRFFSNFQANPTLRFALAQSLSAIVEYGFAADGGDLSGFANQPWTNYPLWEQQVRDAVNSLIAAEQANYVSYEIWNEPDSIHYWGGTQAQFFETYRRAFLQIRALVPNAKIDGPGIANGSQDPGWITAFLQFASANGVCPNHVTWHEFPNEGYVTSSFLMRVATVRASIAANCPNVTGILIDEMLELPFHLAPGAIIASYANFQRANVVSPSFPILAAASACWVDSGGAGCFSNPPTLDGMLTLVGQRRSSWWARKVYADLVGRYARLTADANFDGLTSWDSGTGTIRTVIGNTGSGPFTNVRLQNLGSITAATSGTVTVERIPYTATSPLAAPVLVSNATVGISGGQMVIPISGGSQWDVYAITVTLPGGGGEDTTPPSTPSGLIVGSVSASQINLAWSQATDNASDRPILGAGVSVTPVQEHLTTATTMYREMDIRFWLEQAETELRELS
jgi:hypothetical protein